MLKLANSSALLIGLAATLATSFSATFATVARGIGFDHDDFIAIGAIGLLAFRRRMVVD